MKGQMVALLAVGLLATVMAQSPSPLEEGLAPATTGTTSYNLTLTGAQNSPAVNDPSVGEAYLLISFNTASNNITYQLSANNISGITAAHIHVNAAAGANGSVGIPLYQSPFLGLPGSTTTGLLAASALTPAVFVGPLEVLPDYNNVDVPTVLGQYVIPGLAYAQVHTMAYPDGAIRAQFDNSSIISASVEAIYGSILIDAFTGEDVAEIPFVYTNDVTNSTMNTTMAG